MRSIGEQGAAALSDEGDDNDAERRRGGRGRPLPWARFWGPPPLPEGCGAPLPITTPPFSGFFCRFPMSFKRLWTAALLFWARDVAEGFPKQTLLQNRRESGEEARGGEGRGSPSTLGVGGSWGTSNTNPPPRTLEGRILRMRGRVGQSGALGQGTGGSSRWDFRRGVRREARPDPTPDRHQGRGGEGDGACATGGGGDGGMGWFLPGGCGGLSPLRTLRSSLGKAT